MNKEKKQMIAVISLAGMILTIGAFQFMGGSAEEPKKEEPKKAAPSEVKKPTPEEATKSLIIEGLITDLGEKFFDPNIHNLAAYASEGERLLLGKGSTRIAVYDFGVKL